MADLAAQRSGFEVRHDHDLLADKAGRVVPGLDACADLATFGGAVIQAEFQQLVRVRVRLGAEHRGHAEVDLREVVEGNLGQGLAHFDSPVPKPSVVPSVPGSATAGSATTSAIVVKLCRRLSAA